MIEREGDRTLERMDSNSIKRNPLYRFGYVSSLRLRGEEEG